MTARCSDLLVALQCQHVVGPAADDLLGDRLLGPHRVDRHDPAPHVDLLQQLGDRGDLVGLLGADLLAQGQPVVAGPGGDDVQGAEILLGVMAAAGRLAIDGDDRAIDARLGGGLVAEAGDPGVEAGLEGLGLEHHQDAAEDVLAGDAVGQVEDCREEVLLELGPAGDGGGPGGAGEDGQDGDDQDAGQRVPPNADDRFCRFCVYLMFIKQVRPPLA